MKSKIIRIFPNKQKPQEGELIWQNKSYHCALGKGGVISAVDKKEGDWRTPIGLYPLRWLYYRPDRVERPKAQLETRPLAPNDGWCDEPHDENYNRPIALPYKAKGEALWREDDCYDLIGVIGHNDQPSISDMGSAIFMHIAKKGFTPTRGCIALAKNDLIEIFNNLTINTVVRVHGIND